MKEIFLGAICAIVFLIVWLIGSNIIISCISSVVCLIIAILTIKVIEKEKKVKVDMMKDKNSYDKVRKAIMDYSASILQYRHKFEKLNVEKEVISNMDSIYKSCMKIYDALSEDGSLYTKLNDFSTCYLPGLINILDTYEDLARGSFKTEEAQKFASQFVLFISQITDVFDKKYYNLYSGDVLDSKAEMAAMTALFESEGLVDNKDFVGGRK